MKFEIEYYVNQEKALKKYKVFNKSKVKKVISYSLIMFLLGIILILLDLVKSNENESFGFGLTLGPVLLFMTILNLYVFITKNSNFRKRIQLHYDNDSPEKVIYELHEDRILKKDSLTELSFNWEYFEKYMIVENYLVLISKLDRIPIFAIDLNDLEETKKKELIEFLKSK
jgi:hypothetical protein